MNSSIEVSESLRRRARRERAASRGDGWRLRTYFVLLAACFVAAAAAAVVYVEVQTGRDARAAGDRDAAAAATVAARELGSVLKTLNDTVANLAANPQLAAQVFQKPAGCTLTFDVGEPGGGHVDILRPSGAVACTSRARPTGSYAGASWLLATQHGRVFRAPIRDGVTGTSVAVAAAPVPQGKGTVAAFLDLAPIGHQLVQLYGGGKPIEMVVVDTRTNRVVARSSDPKRWLGRSVADTPLADDVLGSAHDLDGTRRFFATRPVPGSHWRLAAGEDAHWAEAAGNRLERRQLAIILIGLVGVLVAAALVYRRTARPIALLAAAVRARGTGAASVPAEAGGPAEVSGLGADVNALVASVDAELAERRRAEDALRTSEESYRLLFERHPAPMWLFDPETLRFLAVNEAAVRAYGYTREEFLAMTIEDIRPAEDVDELHRQIEDDERGFVEARVWRHHRKDRTEIDVAISSNSVEFAGRPARVVLARDVTEQRRLEEQLRQTQKMEAIGRLAGGVAHDFNNLLVVIRGYSATLAEALADDELQQQAVAIDQAGERAASLTRQLLALSRQQVLRPAVVSVNDVVSETRVLLDRLIGEDVELTTELEPDPWLVLADPGQLVQVVLNLAVNARDAMPDGGTLAIRTSNVELDADYAAGHVGVEPGHYVLLQVTDSGVGMDRETQEHVFEPFFTTKSEGTGLGLATVHGIVTQSGGHIWLYSEPGLGTTFKLYLRRTEHAPSALAAPAPDAAGLAGGETVLLVEDDPGVRAFVSLTLSSYGYAVLEADRADTAEQVAAETDEISLLITDVVMPGRSGRELADSLRTSRPGLRVLFTSGYPGDAVLQSGDGTEFLEKPFGPLELAQAVRRLLDRSEE